MGGGGDGVNFEVYFWFCLVHVLPDIIEEKEFMICTAAHHKGVIDMF